MPPRPFPFPLNIGIDIQHMERIRRIITNAPAKGKVDGRNSVHRFLGHFLTSREQEAFWRTHPGMEHVLGHGLEKATQYLAGRWAAKEAVIKACTYRRLTFHDIQILRTKPLRTNSPVYALILDKPASGRLHESETRHLGPSSPDRSSKEGGERDAETTGEVQVLDAKVTPAELQTDEIDGQVAKVSISHDGEYATAVCLAVEEPREGDVGGEAAARGL